ncbi:hypothetical protein BpHYR1_024243 [Brachionus plicatilis]|uniref:Uncharacterized protein n=1 Tax=Brachionus plicatilis TaxID=10195 RepID=A0A3M7R8D6_BRAPC|nr:hypothetical protein BpHYR1_024243 [Brachionus plicatilis]
MVSALAITELLWCDQWDLKNTSKHIGLELLVKIVRENGVGFFLVYLVTKASTFDHRQLQAHITLLQIANFWLEVRARVPVKFGVK